jgi:predicted DCC family thiol-disulfide oxidoreductase YuxK
MKDLRHRSSDHSAANDEDQKQTDAAGAACSLTVFHDGSCPLCRREIALAQKMTASETFAFVDVSAANLTDVAPGLSADKAMRRFHVRRADGTLLSGAAAFIALWSHTPHLKWLAKLARWPAVISALDVVYSGVLIVRPALSSVVRRLEGDRQSR